MTVPWVLWEVFSLPGVRLACSYYSDDSEQHAAITGRTSSHARTKANIAEALRQRIPLRVGVINLVGYQRWELAVAELEALGVAAEAIGIDRWRQVGWDTPITQASPDSCVGTALTQWRRCCPPATSCRACSAAG